MNYLIGLVLMVSLSGCAAILGSKQKNFDLRTEPQGADVYLNGSRLGTTPVKVQLSNLANHTFVFRKQGYKETTCTLTRGTDAGWVILDVLFGLVPIVIDAATNNWSQTRGKGCVQPLEPLMGAPQAAPAPVTADVTAPRTAPTAAADPTPPLTAQSPPAALAPAAPVTQPMVMDDVPPGVEWIANASTKTYYTVGCPATAGIPLRDRLYYKSVSSLQAAGFIEGDCDRRPPALPEAPRQADTSEAYLPLDRRQTFGVSSTPEEDDSRPQRRGFWFNGGLGWGSLGCADCSGREGGLSGIIGLGGTLSQKVTLGVTSTGWTKEESGVRLTVGTLTGMIRFYPSNTTRFFLLGGLGLGTIRVDVSGFGNETETGPGALLGLGYDIRLGDNTSLTAYWNGFAADTETSDANVGQLGLSITAH